MTVRMDGRCKRCGGITITAGAWRTAQNPSRFVRVQDGDEDRADWSFGNPLTYNDPLSRLYGRKRFGHMEGLHGVLQSRFGLIKNKRWFRRRDQARLDTAMIFCVLHTLGIEQRRLVARTAALGLPPLPPAGPPPSSP